MKMGSTRSSGGGPPAYIDIDLGRATEIGEVRLIVAQFPAGRTEHRVQCRATAGGSLRTLGSFSGRTADLDVLTLTLSRPATCRILRVRTVETPSWVAWREIELFPARR